MTFTVTVTSIFTLIIVSLDLPSSYSSMTHYEYKTLSGGSPPL